MHLKSEALVVAVRAHGEHGAVVRALTPDHGIRAGYVRGGRSRRIRPILVPGNRVQAEYRARTEDQLPYLEVELAHSRAFLLSEPLASVAIEWACALTASAVPEAQAYPDLYAGLDGLLQAIEAAPSARGWSAALVRFELLLLADLGFGLDRIVTRRIAPELLAGSDAAAWPEIHAGLQLTGDRLARDLLTGRQSAILAARERLTERLKRAGG